MKKLTSVLVLSLSSLTIAAAGSQPSLERLLEPFEAAPVKESAPDAQEPAQAVPEASADRTETFKVTQEDAIDALLKASKAAIHEDDSVEITIKSGFRPVTVPKDAEWRLFTADRFAPDNRGRWLPSLLLEVNGELEERWRLQCEVDLYRMVYMTTQRLGRGETPMSPGIHPVICNIYDESSRPVPVSEELDNYEMVRSLAEGHFLTWDDISARRAVRKGETVEVILKKGRLSVTMQAMCLQDGLVDETVRLKNPRTRAEFAGVVTAPGTVNVVN